MIPERRLSLDANILLRAIFGVHTSHLIGRYKDSIALCASDHAFSEARSHVPLIAMRRGLHSTKAFEMLDELERTIEIVGYDLYAPHEAESLARIARRDPNDWPILASALFLDCPLWTEDRDFFGTGIATWTTDNIELYLSRGEPVRP